MQDLIFYVAAKETLGKVRDYSNMRSSDAPLLTLGVAVCLRMRLFEDIEDSTPYPIASFDSITSWNWRMDADYDRRTACKLVADAEGISVHTVTDTIKSETMSFTEVVIPISNMNTRELAAWIDNEKIKTGLAGELVGYDNEGHAAFVLQIENFSVRNRLSGLNDEDEDDPIPVDQEIVTRPLAEQMIQAAVSASAATKQDKLTSGNAGTGISISNAGVISTENVPQSAVTGLSVSLASKQDKLTSGNAGAGISISDNGIISVRVDSIPQSSVVGLESALNNKQNSLSTGFWIEIDDDWISVERYHAIHGPYSRGSITLQAGEAYKIFATNSVVTLDAESIPNNTWGLDGYLEIFVANTGYVQTTSRVVLANALEPDAVNNCRVEFRDGLCTITMENTLAGYIVTLTAGTGEGSLPYALSVSSSEYVAFDATTNGQTLDLAGATTYAGEKHVVGNGYAETAVSGGITCTSKTTFSNLTMLNVTNSGGTMTLGDVNVPSGSTVAVSGGGLAIEKVVGEGSASVVAFGSSNIQLNGGQIASCNGVVFSGGSTPNWGVQFRGEGGTLHATSCVFTGAKTYSRTAVVCLRTGGEVHLTSCTFAGNSTTNGGVTCFAEVATTSGGVAVLDGCTFSENNSGGYGAPALAFASGYDNTMSDCKVEAGQLVTVSSNSILELKGSNSFAETVTGSGSVTISSGAIVDLTGNSNATPIAPGGGITFEPGGATVYPSAGSAAAFMLDNFVVTAITSDAVQNNSATYYSSGNHAASNVVFTKAGVSGFYAVQYGATVTLTDCTLWQDFYTDTSGANGGTITIAGNLVLSSGSLQKGGTRTTGTVILSDGAKVYCNLSENINPIQASHLEVGTNVTFYTSGGTAVPLTGGTYTNATIDKNGTITEA